MGVPISNVTRRVVYAASGTGPYAFTFEILANTDIAVYKDDALLTLTTDYTVSIAGNGTGSITLTASPTGATQIAIVGNRTIQRTTDFVTGGDFFANTVNDEMDQQTIFAQQNAEGLQRALSAPQTDPTSINMTLPRAALRANKALGFDANGNPAIADTLGTNRGNWASGTLYYVRDIVKDTTNSNIWQCIVQHTSSGSQPISTNADAAKWSLLVDAAAAATSASNAATSASNAASSASAASTSASNASSSASTASTQASNASTSASNAASSASAASSSATSAASSATSAAASYDAFDDRYLGSKASDPTVDNDGNALLDGALYWDTTNNILKVYDLGATTWRRTTPTTSDQANINTVSGIAANVTTVAGISANVTTVAGISANVTTVATNNSNVTTVATNIANVNATGGNIANVNSVAGNATNINAAVSNATNINTVAGISANVTTVATNNANVTTVAGSIASVNTNATNIANINQNAANITAIQNASANATSAASNATAAATSASAAAASAASASAVVLGNEPVRPSIRPSLLLDFANTKTLDPRITFTRASTATYYDGVTTAMAEQNLLLQSQTFSITPFWATPGTDGLLSVTDSSVVAPDGTTTASTFVENSGATTAHGLRNASTLTTINGQAYTASAYLKAGTRQFAALLIFTGSVYEGVVVDLSGGTITSTTGTLTSSSITAVGNSWYRVVITKTLAVTSTNFGVFLSDSGTPTFGSGRPTYTGNGTGSIYVWGAQLEQRSAVTAYTATTTQPITNYIPVLKTAASGVARFDNKPTTGESLGLLIEEQRTNLILQSADFTTTWNNAGVTSVGSNVSIAPDGTQTADKLIEAATTGQHYIVQSATVSSAASYTGTVYVKAGERQSIVLRLIGATTYAQAYFNLVAGTVTQSQGTGVITSVGNGWYRCSLTGTSDSTTTGLYINIGQTATATSISSYTGDGFSGLFLWGAQLEAGAFATSYIPTVASQVTRSADEASMTGTNFSSWYRQDEGTLFAEAASSYAIHPAGSQGGIYVLSDGSNDRRIAAYKDASASSYTFSVMNGGVVQAVLSIVASSTASQTIKTANAYKLNDFACCGNGGAVSTDTSGTIPSVTQFQIGQSISAGWQINGHIRKIAYYPLRVTNAQLQGMTTV